MQRSKMTESVDLISELVGKKLGIAGQDARRLAITGALSGTARAFYSRNHSPSATKEKQG